MMTRRRAFLFALLLAAAAPGCWREKRDFRGAPAAAARFAPVRIAPLQPGQPLPEKGVIGPYDDNAWAISEGQRLYGWYNCSGCHFHGAGGIGPSLIDSTWAYGDKIDQIYASIHQGRPNGMPSWGAKLSPTEIWELAAYIRDGADKAKSIPIPTTPTEATPIGAARTVDAPSPAITDLPPATAKNDAEPPKP